MPNDQTRKLFVVSKPEQVEPLRRALDFDNWIVAHAGGPESQLVGFRFSCVLLPPYPHGPKMDRWIAIYVRPRLTPTGWIYAL